MCVSGRRDINLPPQPERPRAGRFAITRCASDTLDTLQVPFSDHGLVAEGVGASARAIVHPLCP